jgi:hypothetical protein
VTCWETEEAVQIEGAGIDRPGASALASLESGTSRAPTGVKDDKPGTAHGRFARAIRDRHLRRAEMAARELGG